MTQSSKPKLSRSQLALGRERFHFLRWLRDAVPASQHVMFRSKPNEPCLLDTVWLPEAARCRELDEIDVQIRFTLIEQTWVGRVHRQTVKGRLRVRFRRWLARLIDG